MHKSIGLHFEVLDVPREHSDETGYKQNEHGILYVCEDVNVCCC